MNTPVAANQPPPLSPPHRPWRRLHASTWAVTAVVGVGLVLVIVPGLEDPRLVARTSYHDSPWTTVEVGTYRHGWPWCFLERRADVVEATPKWWRPSHWTDAPWANGPCWAIGSGVTRFRPGVLAGDAAVAATLLVVIVAGVEWRRRRRHRAWQFTLRELLVVTLLVALAFGWRQSHAVTQARERKAGDEMISLLSVPTELKEWKKQSSVVPNMTLCEYRGPEWLRRLVGRRCLPVCDHVTEVMIGYYGFNGDLPRGLSVLDQRISEFPYMKRLSFGFTYPNENTNAGGLLIQPEPPSRLGTIESLQFDGSAEDVVPLLMHFEGVRSVDLSDPTDAVLARLADLPRLEELTLNATRLTAKSYQVLARLPGLRRVTLDGVETTQENLAGLAKLPMLEELTLGTLEIEEGGLRHLRDYPRLRVVTITWCFSIEPGAIARLREALPECEIIETR